MKYLENLKKSFHGNLVLESHTTRSTLALTVTNAVTRFKQMVFEQMLPLIR